MNNENIHIGIIGAGTIGEIVYKMLVAMDYKFLVSVADVKERDVLIKEDNYYQISSSNPVKNFIENKTLIINAAPFHQNIEIYKHCYLKNVPYFDLSEDDELDKYIDELCIQASISKSNIPFTMPHCGLAPGMSTVIANHLVKKIVEPKDVKIRVGALSQNATNKLKYFTSWSGDGLVNEYLGDCQVVRDGNFECVQALTGYEKLTLNEVEYEAFNTSGGLGTFAKTLSEKYSDINVNYKTLRRIGHHDYTDFLFNDLKLSQEQLTDIFKKCIPKTVHDMVIIYVAVEGIEKNNLNNNKRYMYYKVFRPGNVMGRYMTAIQQTTASGCLTAVELFLNGKLPEKGYAKQEDIDLDQALSTYYGRLYREYEN